MEATSIFSLNQKVTSIYIVNSDSGFEFGNRGKSLISCNSPIQTIY